MRDLVVGRDVGGRRGRDGALGLARRQLVAARAHRQRRLARRLLAALRL